MKNYRGEKHNVQIGRYNEDIYRRMPFRSGVDRWVKNMSQMPELKDFEMILGGSYPHDDANDVDIVFRGPPGMTKENAPYGDLENVFEKGLERGLSNEGIFFDMNASFNEINPIDQDMYNYLQTGQVTVNDSLTYGPQFNVDGKTLRDYSKNSDQYSDHLFDRTGRTPSKKQMKEFLFNKARYEDKYLGKPFMLKERQKIHGLQ
tara:strand:+ start:270 stop:881 length:612 start_codon:yes stop_codon:yes gene_type:complete